MENNLKAGDMVRLKSGGPVMTINSVNTSVFEQVRCVWFVNNEDRKDALFNKNALEVITELPKENSL